MSTIDFSKRHPFLFIAILETSVIFVFIVVFLFLKGVLKTANPDDVDLILNGIAYSILAGAVFILLNRLRWWKEAGFRRPYKLQFLLLFWLPILPLVLNFLAGLKVASIEPWRICVFLIISLLVGFVEEGIFRGLMLQTLLPIGLWKAVIVSSVLFGLAHGVNLVLGENWQAVLLQLVYTTCIYGFASAALVIYTGTIWPIIGIHFLVDFVSWLQAGTTLKTTGVTFGDIFITVVGSTMAIGYGIVLLILTNRGGQGRQNYDVK